MIPTLPTEILLAVLESSDFLHHDLTRIALTCRSFLPFARTRLYQFIQLEYSARINGYALTPIPGTNEKSRGALAILRSNRLLRPLVKKILIRGDTEIMPSTDWSVDLITQLLPLCPSVSIFILKSWKYYPYKLESVFANHERCGIAAGNHLKLSVHFDMTYVDFDMDQGWSPEVPVPLALHSVDIVSMEPPFIKWILINSETSLRALRVRLSDAPSFKRFSNIATLHLVNTSLPSEQELYDAIHQFKHLTTLAYDAPLTMSTMEAIGNVLKQPLPPALRFLSIDHALNLEDAARPPDTLEHVPPLATSISGQKKGTFWSFC